MGRIFHLTQLGGKSISLRVPLTFYSRVLVGLVLSACFHGTPNRKQGIANKFLTFFTTSPGKSSVEQDMPPEQPAEPTKLTEQLAEPIKSTEQMRDDETDDETDDDYLARIKGRKTYARRATSAHIKMSDTGVCRSFHDKLVREEQNNLGEEPEKPGPAYKSLAYQ